MGVKRMIISKEDGYAVEKMDSDVNSMTIFVKTASLNLDVLQTDGAR